MIVSLSVMYAVSVSLNVALPDPSGAGKTTGRTIETPYPDVPGPGQAIDTATT